MYPNKPVNYLKKAIVARRVAVVSIVIALVCVLMCMGYAKQSNEAYRCADSYQQSAWDAYSTIDSLNEVIDTMEGDIWIANHYNNE